MAFEDDDFRATISTPSGDEVDITDAIRRAVNENQLTLDDVAPDTIRLTFGGSVEIDAETALLDILKLGAEIQLVVGDEGHFLSLTADVNSRTWTVTKNKETGEVTGTHSIKLKVA